MFDNDPSKERSEIAFFDVETTVPTRPGQGYSMLEFGSILVCPRTLEEVDSYSTLVKPRNPSFISALSVRCNGITPDAVVSAPTFAEIADTVYDILHGRIWAGHNIVRFDCVRIREAFEEIGRPPPEPKGTIDSLVLLTQKFGRRAGDMKMASLATYFRLGKQTHRSLEDVRMNLEVVKYCATVLFLESSLPDIFTEKSWVSPNATTRSRSNGKLKSQGTGPSTNVLEGTGVSINVPSSSTSSDDSSSASLENLPKSGSTSVADLLANSTAEGIENFDMCELSDEVKDKTLPTDIPMGERTMQESNESSFTVTVTEEISGYREFLDPDVVSVADISAAFVPLFRRFQKMILLHKNVILKLCCCELRVRFGISTKFVDQYGRPRLSFVVDATPSLCRVLEACESAAHKLLVDSGSASDWRNVVKRNGTFCPTVRLHIPTAVNGEIAEYDTEIFQKDPSGTVEKLVFQKVDAAELGSLITPGKLVDAYLSMDTYNYQQSAGIRLVAKKLIFYEDQRQ